MILPSPIQQLSSALFEAKNLSVYIKRDDLIDPVVSGNKWRKLKFNVEKFKSGNYQHLLTFGGAYSNHIAATARVGRDLNIPTIGIIRGDELNITSNATLQQAAEDGMQLIFISREEYDLREEKYYHEELRRRHGHIWIVPEGGANYYGLLGCQEIVAEEDRMDFMITACGTATTATGLLLASAGTVVGVSALKGGDFLTENVRQHLNAFGMVDDELQDEILKRFDLKTDYHFGGYAKYTEELMEFVHVFETEHAILLDQVYTAKMMYALFDLIKTDYFPKGSKIMALHTGGLQGRTIK